LVEIMVDVTRPGECWIEESTILALRRHVQALAEELHAEETERRVEEATAGEEHPHVEAGTGGQVSQMRTLKDPPRHPLTELWDEAGQDYTEDEDRMAEILLDAALSRQGANAVQEESTAGQGLLDGWGVSMAECRTSLQDTEVLAILRGGKKGKRPGPDGVPAAVFHRYASQLVPLFQEAWQELLVGPVRCPEILGRRTWVIAPKEAGARTVARLRDIEICSEARKALARMATTVLDEVMRTHTSKAQGAFLTGRDIMQNNVTIHTAFREAMQSAAEDGRVESLALLLLLDCSKGYNMMQWSWIKRVCTAAGLPAGITKLILAMLEGEVALLLRGREAGHAEYHSGLAQGCPLSCFIFILCVDPFLVALDRIAEATSGLWTIGQRSSAAQTGSPRHCGSQKSSSGHRANGSTGPSRRWSQPAA